MKAEEQISSYALSSGDEKAWKSLFETFYSKLCLLAYQYVHDDDTAENIVQDVISSLWEKRASISVKTSLKSYLFQSVRNRCLDHLKSFNVKNMDSCQPDFFLEREVLDGSYPLGRLLENEMSAKISQILDSLPSGTREVFLRRRDSGMSVKEIAQELGLSENTVKYHIKKALAAFRKGLLPYIASIITFFI